MVALLAIGPIIAYQKLGWAWSAGRCTWPA